MATQNVIIVKKKKGGHGGHHGGAWKVAFADFMTAMMAFFLVMWLVGQSKPIKAAVAGYFRDPGAFDTKGGGDGILDGGKQAAAEMAKPAGSPEAERAALELSVSHIRERLDSLPDLKTLRDQIEFTITSEGLRIDLLKPKSLLRQRAPAFAGDRHILAIARRHRRRTARSSSGHRQSCTSAKATAVGSSRLASPTQRVG